LPNAMPKQIPLCSTLKRTLANAEKFIDWNRSNLNVGGGGNQWTGHKTLIG
jgi:hypothetical protein